MLTETFISLIIVAISYYLLYYLPKRAMYDFTQRA